MSSTLGRLHLCNRRSALMSRNLPSFVSADQLNVKDDTVVKR